MFKKSVLRKFCKKMDILVLKMKLCWQKKEFGQHHRKLHIDLHFHSPCTKFAH